MMSPMDGGSSLFAGKTDDIMITKAQKNGTDEVFSDLYNRFQNM